MNEIETATNALLREKTDVGILFVVKTLMQL